MYQLQPKQVAFVNANAKYRLFGWSKGWWKSYACRAEAVRQCLSLPWVHWLVLRRTLNEVYNNFALPMQRELLTAFDWKKIFDYNDTKHTLSFRNHDYPSMRSKITFGYCKSFKDVMRYQWVEYDFVCIEELTHRDEQWFRELLWSMRTSKPNIYPNFFWSSNPGNIWHQRVKRLRLDRKFLDNENASEYAFIPANVYDNAILMANDPDYIKTLQSLPEKLRRAYLEGDWNVFIGQYFTEFRERIHVIDPIIPRIWVKRRIISLDYWYTNPSSVHRLAEMNDGTIIVYRELYVTEHTYVQLAAKVKANTLSDEQITAIVVDPAITSKKSETTATTGAEEFAKLGLKIESADNDRIKWWNNFRQHLKPFIDPNTLETTSLLKITRNCVNLIRTLPMMLHDEKKVEDINTTLEDHAVDDIRYWLLYLGEKTASFSDINEINASFINQMNKKGKENIEIRKAAHWNDFLWMEF